MKPLPILLATAVLGACVGMQRGSLFPDDRNEVFVEYFRNDTFYRDVQFLLTEELVNEIHSRPGVRLTTRDQADVVIAGRVTDVQQRVLSEDPDRQVTQSNATVAVEVDILDARTGELLDRRRLQRRTEIVASRGEDLDTAQREAFAFLARDIVRLLESDF